MSTARARELRKQLTDAEKRLWSHLRRNQLGGHHFRRQRPIGPFIVDFICMAKCLIVEVDGGQHADRAEEDARRTAYLEPPPTPDADASTGSARPAPDVLGDAVQAPEGAGT